MDLSYIVQHIINVSNDHPWVFTFIGAMLSILLSMKKEVMIMAKSRSQRSADEQHLIDNGLRREFSVEILIYAPLAALLIILIFNYLLYEKIMPSTYWRQCSIYTLLGLSSKSMQWINLGSMIQKKLLEALGDFVAMALREKQGHQQQREGHSETDRSQLQRDSTKEVQIQPSCCDGK